MMPFGYGIKSGCECNKRICLKQIQQPKKRKKEKADDNQEVAAPVCFIHQYLLAMSARTIGMVMAKYKKKQNVIKRKQKTNEFHSTLFFSILSILVYLYRKCCHHLLK